jgi:predicted AAA+ superfamily ATPase
VLIVDEIQKISSWSEQIKRLWDEDSASRLPLKIVVLGSAPLLIQKGLTESLTGRFEVVRLTHWSFSEMKAAFGWNLDQYVFFGGYPGAAGLIQDEGRWKRYILDSMIETTLSRDLLQLNRIDKPALLRQLFTLGCSYSGQILSYTKLVGQLQDAGNTTTLAHYLELLGAAGMLTGLHKYAGQKVRQRGSSPKFMTLNNAFISAQSELGLEQAKEDPAYWGRLVESAVGAHLVNEARSSGYEIYYWREGEKEVDYVVKKGRSIAALEVKSGRDSGSRSGMEAFTKSFRPKQVLLVGTGGIPLSQFLGTRIARSITI